MHGNRRAFTLIELLVVIAIIGILASIILASLSSARAKSRDSRRKADLNQIRNAIELYINSNNSLPGSSGAGNCNSSSGCDSTGAQPWIPGLTEEFIRVIPVDPINNATFKYRYRTGNSLAYEIDAPAEIDYTYAQNDGGNRNTCPSGTTCRFEIGVDLTRLGNGP